MGFVLKTSVQKTITILQNPMPIFLFAWKGKPKNVMMWIYMVVLPDYRPSLICNNGIGMVYHHLCTLFIIVNFSNSKQQTKTV